MQVTVRGWQGGADVRAGQASHMLARWLFAHDWQALLIGQGDAGRRKPAVVCPDLGEYAATVNARAIITARWSLDFAVVRRPKFVPVHRHRPQRSGVPFALNDTL
jgi:hypothetical protein